MKLIKLLALLILIAVLAAAALLGAVFYYNQSPDLFTYEEYFQIMPGENGSLISKNLQDRGLIRSSTMFSVYSKLMRTGGKMKTGFYSIPSGSTTREIHDLLLAGRQVLYKVTIPEGWTIGKIAAHLESEGITSAEEFTSAALDGAALVDFGIETDSSEGFLYPDTYSFPRNFPGSKVVDTMVATFFDMLDEIYPEYKSLVSGDLYSKIILASIVEKEYRVEGEASMIASVFNNRIETGMALGSCASVVYVKTEILNQEHPESLLYSDLEIDSPYNTYIYQGLPPGPIANPGYTALYAAFYPEESDYYYFLLKDADAGQHYFSRTYSEHNQAYSLYIKKE